LIISFSISSPWTSFLIMSLPWVTGALADIIQENPLHNWASSVSSLADHHHCR
jgi:hypothetical protein